MRNTSTNIFWDVSLDPYMSGTLEYLYIIENFAMLNGIWLTVDLFQNLDVGKAIFSLMVTVSTY
jgi:hypothetical protein